jgi:hypothetical protein
MIMDVCCLEARPNLGQKTPRISRFGKNPVRSRNLGLHLRQELLQVDNDD